MAAHTPGPWHVTKSPYPREIRADDGPFIASVYDVAVTYGERNANARLLAAAPELLDALIVAKGTIEIACGTTAPYVRVALDIVAAALAKVEGTPPPG